MEEADSKTFSPLSYFISLYSAVCGYFRRLLLRVLAVGPVPEHIAIIMDGNRRYADRSHIDRTRGHLYGYDRLISTLEMCSELGVKYVTVYAFSIDNFRRPSDEVQALMNLMEEKLDDICNSYRLTKQNGVRVQVLGELSLLPCNVRAAAERAMASTRHNSSVVLNICVAYTSTVEMVHSIQEIRDKFLATLSEPVPPNTGSRCLCSSKSEAENCSGRTAGRNGYSQQNPENGFVHDAAEEVNLREVGGKSGQERLNGLMTEDGEANDRFPVTGVAKESESTENPKVPTFSLDFITEKEIENHLYTAGCPLPELLIRTSGETRLSNFLLWQCASSHLSFCKVLWPEFSFRHFVWIILDYQRSVAEVENQGRLKED